MTSTTRHPLVVLFIHDGSPVAQIKHLKDAGLRVSETHAVAAVATAKKEQPDIIVLDFEYDGDVTAKLKRDRATRHIPVIALVHLLPTEQVGGDHLGTDIPRVGLK
jgi:CheY-like chemotaxis protein